jgi:hypothetical protein
LLASPYFPNALVKEKGIRGDHLRTVRRRAAFGKIKAQPGKVG